MTQDRMRTIRIKGMSCDGCVRAAARAIAAVQGVDSAEVDLTAGLAVYAGSAEPEAVADAIEDAGFEAIVPQSDA